MPLYECKICNISTKFKTNYIRHLKTSKHKRNVEYPFQSMVMNQNEPQMNQNEPAMNQNEPAMNQENKKYKCDYCDESFNTIPSKRRHELHRCKENPHFIEKVMDMKNNTIKKLEKEKKEILENAEKEKKQLYKQMEKLLDKVGNTTINQTQNINLNSYGKEDISHISDSMKTHFLKIPYGAIPKMIEAIHFNDEKPENKNIMIPNKKENLIKVFKDDKWVYKDKNETLQDLVDQKYYIMDDHYEELQEDGNIDFNLDITYNSFKKYYDDGDKELIDKLKKECEMVLLNNK